MQVVQAVQSKLSDVISQIRPQRITAVALNALGALALASAVLLAPVATTLTTALLIGGSSIFVVGFFLNFFVAVEEIHESAKGIWTNQGKDLEIAIEFGGKPLDMSASLTQDHKIKITWNDSLERIVDFYEIPSMIDLIDKNSRFVFEKIPPVQWLKQFTKVDVNGFNNNNESTRISLSFS